MAKAKILVVEDEAITARDLQNRLTDLGYDAPAIASSGEGAIKKAEEIKPDLVLMDIILKGMDGIEAAEQIRDRFDIPVIYLTAYLDEERLEKTKVSEPYGYIIKPFGGNDLRPVIEMALQRHKLEKALRNAEQDWRNSFNSLGDVMLIIDRDYNIENINELGLKLLGKSKAEVIGKKCYQVISGLDSPSEDCPCRKSLETKKVESIDRYEESFGKHYSIKSSPIFDENGEIIKFVDLRRDITERKQMEEALRENEERFQALTESTSDWIWEVDENGVYTYTNPKIKELLGYEPEEIIGKTPFDLMTPEDVKHVAAEFGAIVEAQKPFDRLENENLHKNGQILVLETSGVPIFDANGNFRGYRGIDRDITECKRAEEELLESEERFRTIVETAPSLLIITDAEGNNIYVSPNCEEITGYTQEELRGELIWWVHEDDTPRAKELFERTFREGEGSKNFEYKIVKKSGEVRHVSSSWEPLKDEEGKFKVLYSRRLTSPSASGQRRG